MRSFVFLLAFLFINMKSFAQTQPEQKDSTEIYKDIESYSKKGKFTKFIYGLIFKPIDAIIPGKKGKVIPARKVIPKSYKEYEGKVIRKIEIKTLDPFGYSVKDTARTTDGFLPKAGNAVHLKSQNITIRNLLLIHKNQLFDSLLVKESERLVRTKSYVSEVAFSFKLTSKNSDSVDVYIIEHDRWSIIPRVAVSPEKLIVNLTDKNFLGLGHESQNEYAWYHTTGSSAFKINYFIPNIKNTFATSTLHYEIDQYGNFNKTIAVDRPLFSSFAKWAAGVYFSQYFSKDSIPLPDATFIQRRFRSNTQDFWAANSMQIFKGNSEDNRTTNFISSARYLRIHYLEKPPESLDTFHIYANEDFYLASIGISGRKYLEDKYIFNFGLTEDVPIGKVYSITGGYQIRNSIGRTYVGLRFAKGNYAPWGYLSVNLEYGTYYRASKAEQGTILAGLTYFTDLMEVGQWKIRQFIKPQVTIGTNRQSYESININETNGITGFNSLTLNGTDRLLIKFQTQFYAPWRWIGFRFGPYLTYSAGMLGDLLTNFTNSKVYSQIGLGVLIKNDYLVFGTFQFSISFYPSIPDIGQNIFKFNSVKTNDIGFRDFESGKPAVVAFQ